jgi:hypothetical protein
MVKRTAPNKATPPALPAKSRKTASALVAALEHPHKDAIDRLIVLTTSADPRIELRWKWNAPSLALSDDFATFHLRAKEGVSLIMHFGAKKRATPSAEEIADPKGLLTWLAKDRAQITFADLAAVEANKKSFVALIRAWIAALP